VLVSELESVLSGSGEHTICVDLGDIEINDDATSLKIGPDFYALDEVAEKALCTYLKVPYKYIKDAPTEVKSFNLKYWKDAFADITTEFDVYDGDIVSIHSPDQVTLPKQQVAEMISSVFEPDNEVRLYQDNDQLHIDVLTAAKVEVLNPDGIPFRPAVGDITRGGVRLLAYPHMAKKQPSVGAYLERLVCTNGMCSSEKLGMISITGRTVPEVIEQMELAARKVLGGLDEALDKYLHTASVPVTGTLQAFAHQLAKEHNFTRAVLDEVMNIINQLPQGTATVYDVIQAFTSVANQDLSYSTRMKLQTLGGELALDTERACNRCGSCERLLG